MDAASQVDRGFLVESSVPVMDEGFCNGPDELTCAICLGQIPPPDLAMVAGCEHLYCVHCILSWALCNENPSCPQCKHKFQHLFVHRQLDGTITDFPVRESVCLLQRATWFEDRLSASDKKKLSGNYVTPDDYEGGGFYEDDYVDDDDDLEDYYYSRAAGRARLVIGNRRFGENGVLQSGRRYASPAVQQKPAGKAKARGKLSSSPAASSHVNQGAGSSSGCGAYTPSSAGASASGSSSRAAESVNQHKGKGKSKGQKAIPTSAPPAPSNVDNAPPPCASEAPLSAAITASAQPSCTPPATPVRVDASPIEQADNEPGATSLNALLDSSVTNAAAAAVAAADSAVDTCVPGDDSLAPDSGAPKSDSVQAVLPASQPISTPSARQLTPQGSSGSRFGAEAFSMSPSPRQDVGQMIEAAMRPGMGRRAKRSARRHVVDFYAGSYEDEDYSF